MDREIYLKDTHSAGAAAEAYVYFRLRSWGIDAHFAGGINPPFDLWAYYSNLVLKIQVKSTGKLSARGGYQFSTKKGSNGLYHPNDWDIMGLVALPEEGCWFTIQGKESKTRRLPTDCFSPEEERKSWDRTIRLIKENHNGKR